MVGWMPCCCGVCWIFIDDFDRPDSTDVGGNWNEVSGDWVISGWLLHEPSTTTATILGTQPVPARSAGEMRVYVELIDPVVGDEYFIHVGCTSSTAADGAWAKFTYLGSNQWTVLLSTGETKNQTWPPTIPGVFPVTCCLDSDGFLMAGVASSGDEFPWSTNATAMGRYYGLGHGTTSAGAWYDNFQVEELRTETEICRTCFCHCAGKHLPKVLTLSLVNGVDRAVCMTGSVPMNWEWASGAYRWVSDVLTITTVEFKWAMGCGAYDPDNPFAHLGLYWLDGYKTCCAANDGGCGAVHLPIAGSSSCDPLFLRYGPFHLSTGELSCLACYSPGSGPTTGDYYIEITE